MTIDALNILASQNLKASLADHRTPVGTEEYKNTFPKLEAAADFLPSITSSYLLVTNVTCYRDEQGHRYIDQLWYKDLREHFRYLKNFTLAAPCQQDNLPHDLVALDEDPTFSNVQFIDLPSQDNLAKALMLLPTTLAILWQAIGQADIVHTGVAGWPIPFGWLVIPIVQLRGKLSLIVVESAFWRVQSGTPVTIKARIRAFISEQLNRWCVNQADLTIFTQQEYRESLLTERKERGHVIPASWIDEENIISRTEATEIWAKKVSNSTQELKVLFAGRLLTNKGVLVLLEAMKILDNEDIPIKLDILGQGKLLGECEETRDIMNKSAEITILGTVPYGSEFFHLLQGYHAIVVPNISDEQPRIVYDAYSQALPPLVSNTPGLRECVQDGLSGMVIDANDPVALANLLKWALQNLKQLERMGMESLQLAHTMTHQAMHQKRWQLLLKMLEKKTSRR